MGPEPRLRALAEQAQDWLAAVLQARWGRLWMKPCFGGNQ